MTRVAIVGGGISGLTVAYELLGAGLPREELVVLEAAPRAGGHIRSHHEEGYVVEAGPNGFLDNSPPTLELVERLGLADRLLPSNAASAVRFIHARGKLRRVPRGPLGMLGSGLLPLGGRLRIFLEPFVRQGGSPEETVYDFAARRIGASAAGTLVDAMVSGVFAGDARDLELAAAFPKMAAMEAEHGGLVKAMLALARRRKREARERGAAPAKRGGPAGPGGHLTSFVDGFEELPTALIERLGDRVRTGCAIDGIAADRDGHWSIARAGEQPLAARAVVLACPADQAARLTGPVDAQLAAALREITSSTIAVVAHGYRLADVGAAPPGFGFLVPRGEGPRILGCLWTSSIWDGRAPADRVLLRTMVGGVHDPAAVELDDDELARIVARDLERCMGLTASPVFTRIYRHRTGIAQYRRGHGARLARIDERLASLPGLFVSGSSYRGISVNHCVAEAPEVARRLLAQSSSGSSS
jgi:oxygen-dependent protoporphyrinogen oxidase